MKTPLIYASMLASALSLSAAQPNVLFIAVDDLKPLLGCYDTPAIKTPQIDRLASQGTVFSRAYCQQAVCGPTRVSLLTGLRPDTTKVWDLKTRFRSILPDVVTLPQYFREHGYETVGMGKIFDPRSVEGREADDKLSWSRPYIQIPENPNSQMGFLDPAFVARAKEAKKTNRGNWEGMKKALGGTPAVEIDKDVADVEYEDGALAEKGVELIGELAKGDKPFFLAVGFHKPHLPFIAPKKYADLYDRKTLQLAEFQKMPEGAPEIAFQDSYELKNGSYSEYTNMEGLLPEDKQRELIHGYMACVSYVDAQVGKLLDALKSSGVADNTIVVFWGDHGWHLGDHGMWCKHTNFEQATRVPLIISSPAKAGGKKSESPVEFLDIYPTLCELAGLPTPEGLHGTSLAPVLADPKFSVKPYAVSQYPRGNAANEMMGYAFRDGRYRYVRWIPKGPKASRQTLEELYDYEKDPLETKSLIDDPEYATILAAKRGEADGYFSKYGPAGTDTQ